MLDKTIARINAWKYFYPEGNGKAKHEVNPFTGKEEVYDLHHIDYLMKKKNVIRYNQWNINDLIIIPHSEHMLIHRKLETNPFNYPINGTFYDIINWLYE